MAPRISQVTPMEVRKAVLGLESQKKKPTVIAVREWLGGGSTKILSEILNKQKSIEEDAIFRARKITAQCLFDIITRELSVAMSDSYREHAAALLAGYFCTHNNAKTMTVREYVDAGFIELSILEERAERIISEIYRNTIDDNIQEELHKELWLRAFSHASRSIDKKDLALLFVEDWLDLQDLD